MNELEEKLVTAYGNRLVRRVIDQEDWASEAIYEIAAGDKKNWTPIEWQAVLSDLERSPLKVKDWVKADG